MVETGVQKTTIKSIQILRALAAFMVAYLHSTGRGGVNLLPHSGGFGVDIFFIISGFVIAYMAERDTRYFFIKRLFRIVPLYILATLIMAAACIIFPEKINKAVVNIPAVIKSILFIPYKIETKFEPSGPLLDVGWTLNYEMFFYLIMTFCIMLVKNKTYRGIFCAAALTAIYTVLNIINSDIFIVKYYQNSLFPEFTGGIILYYIYRYLKRNNQERLLIRNRTVNIILFGIIALVCFAYMTLNAIYKWHTTSNRNIYSGIPAWGLVFAMLNLESEIKSGRITKIFLELGDASYALYLFHTFIITFFTRIMFAKIIADNKSIIISIILEIIIMTITIIGSIVIYRILDKPVQKYLRKETQWIKGLKL